MCVFMCDFILYFNDYVLHLCVINDDSLIAYMLSRAKMVASVLDHSV